MTGIRNTRTLAIMATGSTSICLCSADQNKRHYLVRCYQHPAQAHGLG